MNPTAPFEHLFSYGSLQTESVQLSTFGRTLAGTPDILAGYRSVKIEILDKRAAAASGADFYLNAQFTGHESDFIMGTKFEVTKQELEHADVYEAGANYERVMVPLKSGARAWVYVSNAQDE